jgi:hypothetical protein
LTGGRGLKGGTVTAGALFMACDTKNLIITTVTARNRPQMFSIANTAKANLSVIFQIVIFSIIHIWLKCNEGTHIGIVMSACLSGRLYPSTRQPLNEMWHVFYRFGKHSYVPVGHHKEVHFYFLKTGNDSATDTRVSQ